MFEKEEVRVRKFSGNFSARQFYSWSVGQANPIYGRKRQNDVNELHAGWSHVSGAEVQFAPVWQGLEKSRP